MKKALIVLAIMLSFAVFAVSCGMSKEEETPTTAASTTRQTQSGDIDWNDVTGTTTAVTTASPGSHSTTASPGSASTAASTTVDPEHTWSPGTDNGDGWSDLNPL